MDNALQNDKNLYCWIHENDKKELQKVLFYRFGQFVSFKIGISRNIIHFTSSVNLKFDIKVLCIDHLLCIVFKIDTQKMVY